MTNLIGKLVYALPLAGLMIVGGQAVTAEEAPELARPSPFSPRPQAPIATPLKELLDSLAAKCADWRKSDEDLTAENAARALAVCNELAPERVLSARVPGLETSVMLDVPSAAIGAGFGVLVVLALRGLVAMFRGSPRPVPAPARIVEPIWSGYSDRK